MKTLFKIILLAYLGLIGTLSMAQIPETQYSQGISYITGGVGQDEALAILAESKQWPLFLEMSQIENGRGVWIFGATIKILNSSRQTIFNAQADGPFILVNLLPGDYTIEATYEGATQKRSFSIKSELTQKIALFWK